MEASAVSRRITATPAAPIPMSYSASNAQSLILSEVAVRDKNLMLIATMNGIACQFGESSVSAPTAPDGSVPNGIGLEREFYLLSSEPTYVSNVSRNVYCRSFTGAAATSGELYLQTY